MAYCNGVIRLTCHSHQYARGYHRWLDSDPVILNWIEVASKAIPNRWDMMMFGSQAIGTADNTDATSSQMIT